MSAVRTGRHTANVVRDTEVRVVPRLEARQRFWLLGSLVAIVAIIATLSVVTRPSRAKTFDLFHGSLFLDDKRAPVAVDLTDGKPTIRLLDANRQVSAVDDSTLDVVPLETGTLLLNQLTGEFNIVDNTGFVVKTDGGGVTLPRLDGGATGALGLAAGDSAYVIQTGPSGSAVYLVGQATVESARSVDAKVTPRASARVEPVAIRTPGAAVVANGDVWVLTGSATGRTVRQLSVPQDSDLGVTLSRTDHGTVTGAAALAAASRNADGTGHDVVGVATATEIRVFVPDAGSPAHVVRLPGLGDVRAILPVTDGHGSLTYLYDTPGGWDVVSVTADGVLTAPRALSAIPVDARLAPPVASGGAIYTMSQQTDGTMWQIAGATATHVPGLGSYPLRTGADGRAQERPDFTDARVLARGNRVVFNSPDHELAATVFTDRSHTPVRIDKSAAVNLNAAGGAAAIIPQPTPGRPQPQPTNPVNPVVPAAPAINVAVKCQNTTQVPHVPTITEAAPASRSVLLAWNYPLLDSQDCVPSTYVVAIQLVGGNAPAPPGKVTVQGQTGVNVTGLYPNTHYSITVTAFINRQGTTSQAVPITTGREGPSAPNGVSTSTDQAGNWTVTWRGCGAASSACIPASSWTVVPAYCDGVGLSAPPSTITVTGDPTLRQFRAVYPGGLALLGRGLTFQVQGIGDLGDIGVSGGDGSCSYSWRPPDPSKIQLTVGKPDQTSLGATTTATFTTHFSGSAVAATGGIGALYTYQLQTGGQTVATNGPSTATSATFDNISAGTTYSGLVVVTPPRHPEAAVTIGPVPVSTSAAWPQLSVASASVAASSSDPTQGTLRVTLAGLASSDARGERFDLVDSHFDCSSYSLPLSAAGFDPSTVTITAPVNLLQATGACTVTVALTENASTQTSPPVFGGSNSPAVGSAVDMPSPPGPLTATDFQATWSGPDANGGYSVSVSPNTARKAFWFGRSWTATVSDAVDTSCGTAGDARDPSLTIAVTCSPPPGDAKWQVTVDYTLFGKAQDPVIITDIGGTPPVYTEPTPTPTPTDTPTSSDTPTPTDSATTASS